MAHALSEEESEKLQEHESLEYILNVIPAKVYRGLSSVDVDITCIDVSPEYLALGTNVGIVYLFDRAKRVLQKLACQVKHEVVSQVKMCNTIDYVVAVGTAVGHIYLFVLPSLLPGRNKQLKVVCVMDMHISRITCLEWSPNGIKLFSGDEGGGITCTEFDSQEKQSKSYPVSVESSGIVQMDYAFKILLLSTQHRTALCFPGKNTIIQVGSKDRKSPGPYGACFVPDVCQSADAVLFAARPGLRLWKADTQGKVQATYLYKDTLAKDAPTIPLLSDTAAKLPRETEQQFGPLAIFGQNKKQVVTWYGGSLCVLDPFSGTVIGSCHKLGVIKSLVVCDNEIFLLRKGHPRKLIRISSEADPLAMGVVSPEVAYLRASASSSSSVNEEAKLHGSDTQSVNSETGSRNAYQSPMHRFTATASKMSLDLFNKLKDVGEKVQVGEKDRSRPETPPWGTYGLKESPVKIQTLEGVTALKVTTDVNYSEISSQQNHSEQVQSEENHSINLQTQPSHSSITDERSIETNPEVRLVNDDLLSVTVAVDKDSNEPAEAVDMLEEEFNSIEDHIEKTKDTEEHKLNKTEVYNQIGKEEFSDIVFTRKQKKQRKKRHKLGTKLDLEKDSDTGSVGSTDTLDSLNRVSSSTSLNKETKLSSSVSQEDNRSDNVQNFEITKPPIEKHDEEQEKTAHDSKTEPEEKNKMSDTSGEQNKLCEGEENLKGESVKADDENNQLEAPANETQTDEDKKATFSLEETSNIEENQKDNILFENEGKNVEDENQGSENKIDPLNTPSLPEDGNQSLEPTKVDVESVDNVDKNTQGNPNLDTNIPSQTEEAAKVYQSPDSSVEDFYSKYRSDSMFFQAQTLEDAMDKTTKKQSNAENTVLLKQMSQQELARDTKFLVADNWTDFLAPGNLMSLCITNNHVWCVDKSEGLHYSSLSGPGLRWKKVDIPAQQIAVSPSGWVVWRLYKGFIHVGTNITPRQPYGLKWVEIARDVIQIAADDNQAWYVKHSGEVVMHRDLSKERPCSRANKVPCAANIIQVHCRGGVVWALTDNRQMLVRVGMSPLRPEGSDWVTLHSLPVGILVGSFCMGDQGTAWILDMVGRIWFTNNVTLDTPFGNGHWWQVSQSRYLMQDKSTMDHVRDMTDMTQVLSFLNKHEKSGLITAGSNGLWVCPASKNIINVCRGSIIGHQWELATPVSMASTSKWELVDCKAVSGGKGLIWIQQPNGDLFCLTPSSLKTTEVSPPAGVFKGKLLCISACSEALWCLTATSDLFIRTGMGPHCPQGVSWTQLDLQQLGDKRVVHVSCGTQNVWAVDNEGGTYLRIGVNAPSSNLLPPAWVPVEGSTHSVGAHFVKVYSGTQDWMVWAVDSKYGVYVRKGVSDTMPIGTHWLYVPGTGATSLCLSENMVYALDSSGEILVRYGIAEDNVMGNYWKKVPGTFTSISVTGDDELWGISREKHLQRRHLYFLQRQEVLQDLVGLGESAKEDDWELL